MSNWTLESELKKVAAKETVSEALASLGLIDGLNAPYRLLVVEGWRRGGSGTYLYDFGVQTSEGFKRFLIKACTPPAIPGSNVEVILSSWIERRSILARNGIQTPKLYHAGNGIVIEEFIPMEVTEILELSSHRAELLGQLARLAAVLDLCGFAPSHPFEDLRSRGADVVVVDFGFDLGPPALSEAQNGRALPKLLKWLNRHLPSLERTELATLEDQYRHVIESHGK